MHSSQYLLFITDTAILEEYMHYFQGLGLALLQKNNFLFLNKLITTPKAFIIQWNLLKDNLNLLPMLYHKYAVPLIVMDNTVDEEVCIKALEKGADDFIVTPIHPRELYARICSISRRINQLETQLIQSKKMVYQFANWYFYPASRQIFNKDYIELKLSIGEYDLLKAFVEQPQTLLSRDFLLQISKNATQNPFDRRIDVQISRLRHKIEISGEQKLIKTVRNGGYMFTSPVFIKEEG